MFPAKGRDSRPATAAMLRLDVRNIAWLTTRLQPVSFGAKGCNHFIDGIGLELNLDLLGHFLTFLCYRAHARAVGAIAVISPGP